MNLATHAAFEHVVLIPIKSFDRAKSRLTPILDSAHRRELAKSLATDCLAAASGCTTCVVSDDQQVLDWVGTRAALPVLQPDSGLNNAIRMAAQLLRTQYGTTRLLVAHSDIASPAPLGPLLDRTTDVIVPDRRGEGTNVLCVDITDEFRFSYGANSYQRHAEMLRSRSNRPTLHLWNSAWCDDIDTPEDLTRTAKYKSGGQP